MPNDLVIVLLCVACVCLGVALRGYYDDADANSARRAEPRIVGEFTLLRPTVLAGWEERPVTFLQLPRFIRRRSEDKQIARFLIARDTFGPIA